MFSDELAVFVGQSPRICGWLLSPATTFGVLYSGSEVRKRRVGVKTSGLEANLRKSGSPTFLLGGPSVRERL